MEDQSDLYTLLGCKNTASPEDIRQSFRKLALKYHPDKNPSKDATNQFQQINAAYAILSDPISRQDYDRRFYNISQTSYYQQHPEYHTSVITNLKSLTVIIHPNKGKAWLQACQQFYGQDTANQGVHGYQIKGPYISPDSRDHIGSISVTIYPEAKEPKLLIQGTSYMLWKAEHLPQILPLLKSNKALTHLDSSTTKQETKNARGLYRQNSSMYCLLQV
jgi:curved DNA-binding protein CbpA